MKLFSSLVINTICITSLTGCNPDTSDKEQPLSLPSEFKFIKTPLLPGYSGINGVTVNAPNFFNSEFYKENSTSVKASSFGTWVALHQGVFYEKGEVEPIAIENTRYFYVKSKDIEESCGLVGFYERTQNEFGEYSQNIHLSQDGESGYTENIQHIKISDSIESLGSLRRTSGNKEPQSTEQKEIYCISNQLGNHIGISLNILNNESIENIKTELSQVNIWANRLSNALPGSVIYQELHNFDYYNAEAELIEIRTTDSNIYFKLSSYINSEQITTELQTSLGY